MPTANVESSQSMNNLIKMIPPWPNKINQKLTSPWKTFFSQSCGCSHYKLGTRVLNRQQLYQFTRVHKQRFLTPGHQGWNDLHSLCRIGMECYLLNTDDNNIIYWIMMIIMMMMIIIMIIMMTMMIIGTATIMIMIIIITTTLTMTIMKMIMIKTVQTPCQSLYKDRRI